MGVAFDVVDVCLQGKQLKKEVALVKEAAEFLLTTQLSAFVSSCSPHNCKHLFVNASSKQPQQCGLISSLYMYKYLQPIWLLRHCVCVRCILCR